MPNMFSRIWLGYEDPDITAGANRCIDKAPHCVVVPREIFTPPDITVLSAALKKEFENLMMMTERLDRRLRTIRVNRFDTRTGGGREPTYPNLFRT